LADQTKEKKNDIDEMLNEEFGGDSQLDPVGSTLCHIILPGVLVILYVIFVIIWLQDNYVKVTNSSIRTLTFII